MCEWGIGREQDGGSSLAYVRVYPSAGLLWCMFTPGFTLLLFCARDPSSLSLSCSFSLPIALLGACFPSSMFACSKKFSSFNPESKCSLLLWPDGVNSCKVDAILCISVC